MSLDQAPEITIYQGEDKNLTIRVCDQDTGDPFDLTSASQIEVLFPNADGSALVKTLTASDQVSIVNAGGGIMSVRLLAADTKLLQSGSAISIEVRVTIAGFLTIAQIPSTVTVLPSLFPTVS